MAVRRAEIGASDREATLQILIKLASLNGVAVAKIAVAAVASVGAVGAMTWQIARTPGTPELAATTAPAEAPAARAALPQAPSVAAAPATPPAATNSDAPAFDVARIESTGEAVIAGRATPGAKVELLRDGQVHDQTVADKAGEFVLIPKPLPRGAYDLSLRATQPTGEQSRSKDSVAVALGPDTRERPLVALVAPNKPAEVLSKPAVNTALKIAIDAVEAEAAGKLYVSGRSPPGTSVRLYLNESYIASGTASAEGKVAFAIGAGVRPGDYQVRLDEVDAATGTVRSRVEVPFTAPAPGKLPAAATEQGARRTASLEKTMPTPPADAAERSAEAVAPTSSPTAPRATVATEAPVVAQPSVAHEPDVPRLAAASQPEVVVVPSIETALVSRGDSLWRISRQTYGRGARYSVIYQANQEQIRDPDRIYPGQVFVLPVQ